MRARYLPSGVLSRRAAMRMLGPYQGLLVQIVLHGWRGWEDFGTASPKVRAETGNRSRASLVSDLMNREAKRRFAKIRAVTVTEAHSQTILGFGGADLRVTFHKIGHDLVPVPRSDRQLEMWSQADVLAQQPPLPGLGSGTWARVGYRLDTTETRVTAVEIICSTNGVVDWIIDLPMPTSAVGSQPLVVPAPPSPKIASTRPARSAPRSSPSP